MRWLTGHKQVQLQPAPAPRFVTRRTLLGVAVLLLVLVPQHRTWAQEADADQDTAAASAVATQRTERPSKRHAAREAVSALTYGSIRPPTGRLAWRSEAAIATLIALTGALLLAIPPLAIYRLTTPRERYDQGLAESLFVLPIAVAGIVTVIQGSLAIAFGLAGVVTTVRFRSALKETNDAGYIFLSVAIGVAAGAEALDIATVLTLFFCCALLGLWGARMYAARRHPAAALAANEKGKKKQGASGGADDEGRHSVIVVHAQRTDAAQPLIEPVIGELTKAWTLQQSTPDIDGGSTLKYSVHLRKHLSPAAVAAAIEVAGKAAGVVAVVATPSSPTTPASFAPTAPAASNQDASGSPALIGVAGPVTVAAREA